MPVYYKCDYNKIPLKEMIKILYGKDIPYTSYALKMYLEGRCIFLSDYDKIYGDCNIIFDAVPISSVINSISLGRL